MTGDLAFLLVRLGDGPSTLIRARINALPDDDVTVTQKHVGDFFSVNFSANFNIFLRHLTSASVAG
jgi:hypothetical protein